MVNMIFLSTIKPSVQLTQLCSEGQKPMTFNLHYLLKLLFLLVNLWFDVKDEMAHSFWLILRSFKNMWHSTHITELSTVLW